jgi:hypothetical protein
VTPIDDEHVPPVHVWPAGQALLQRPQWLALVAVSTQLAPHITRGAAQEPPPVHVPLTHS